MRKISRQVDLVFVVLLLRLATSATLDMCQKQNCDGSSCIRTPCEHGACSVDGRCVCATCWQGESCDVYDNPNVPSFNQTAFSVDVNPDTPEGELLLTVTAHYNDAGSCGLGKCACVDILYAIESGNERMLFAIDARTGDLFTSKLLYPYTGQEHELVVSGHNPAVGAGVQGRQDPGCYVQVKVRVTESPGGASRKYNDGAVVDRYTYIDESDTPKSRRKRALPPDSTPIPSTTIFYLEKKGDFANITELYLGAKVHFLLGVHFPVGLTDVTIELFTPDNLDSSTSVMVLCGPKVSHVGGNLVLGVAEVTPLMDASRNDYNYDRAVLSLGNVTNSGDTATPASDSMVFVEWDVIVVNIVGANDTANNDSFHWVSAGAAYNHDEEVWVGQTSFVTLPGLPNSNDPPPPVPEFNFTGPYVLAVGTTEVYRVNMYIYDHTASLVLRAIAPPNMDHRVNILSICSMAVVDTGANYACLVKERFQYVTKERANANGNEAGVLELFNILNTGTPTGTSLQYKDRISIDFLVSVANDSTQVGQKHSLRVAVEIDGMEIWDDYKDVLLKANSGTSSTPTGMPVFTLRSLWSTANVSADGTVFLELEAKIPPNTEATFTVEASVPYNTSVATFRMCRLELAHRGVNLPCVSDASVEYTAIDPTAVSDHALWNVGPLHNFALRSSSGDDDAVRFRVAAQLVGISPGAEGQTVLMPVGVSYNAETVWIGHSDVLLTSGNDVDISQPENIPILRLGFATGGGRIAVSAGALVRVTVTARPGAIYRNMKVVLSMPTESSSAVLNVCRVWVKAGSVLPCVNGDELTRLVHLFSTSGGDVNDTAIAELGVVHNPSTLTDEATISLTYVVKLEKIVTAEAARTINVELTYTGEPTVSERLTAGAVFVIDEHPPVMPHTSGEAYVGITGPPGLEQGKSATYFVVLKIPPESTADYVVTVSVLTSEFGLCALHVLEMGRNLPCYDVESENYGPISDDLTSTFVKFPRLTNIGSQPLVRAPNTDDNSILLAVVVKLFGNTGTSNSLSVNVDYNVSGVATATLSLESMVATTQSTTIEAHPALTFERAPVSADDVTDHLVSAGQAVMYHLDVTLNKSSSNAMKTSFFVSPDEGVDICDVNVVGAGANVPCQKIGLPEAEFASRHTQVTLDMGYVCQHNLHPDDPEADKVRIECIVKLSRDREVNYTAWLSGNLAVNGDEILLAQQKIVVREGFQNSAHNQSECLFMLDPPGTWEMSPGMKKQVLVTITTPVRSTLKVTLTVNTPLNTSAVFTITSLKFESGGANLACMSRRSAEYFVKNTVYTSTHGTTQNDTATIDLGVVTNTGLTERLNATVMGDNQIAVVLELQMADSVVNNAQSEHQLTITAHIGNATKVVEKPITVVRNDSESPKLIVEANVINPTVFHKSDDVLVEVSLNHSEVSTAEGYNVSAAFYLPTIVQFVNVSSATIDSSYDVMAMTSGNGFFLKFERLFFTDNIVVTLHLRVTADPASDQVPFDAIIPYEVVCNKIWRENQMYRGGTIFASRMNHFTVQIANERCIPAPLGMEDMVIQDCQITGTESPFPSQQPADARLTGRPGWKAATRRGKFERYLQVYFGNLTMVTQVEIRPSSDDGDPSNTFRLLHSDDGINWILGETMVSPPQVHVLISPIKTRYVRVRIQPIDNNNDESITLNVEFYGYRVSADISLAEACEEKNPWGSRLSGAYPDEPFPRVFLGTPDAVYFCDTMPARKHRMSCFTSVDGGTWKAMDNSVVNILSHDPSTSTLYGLAANGRAVVASVDGGSEWASVPYRTYITGPGVNLATDIPWMKNDRIMPGGTTPHMSNTHDNWGANYDGMFHLASGTWNKVVDWTSCCYNTSEYN